MMIYEKLLKIQKTLKCNKGQYNSFGKYYYRSCEDILESAKPIIHANKCTLLIGDEMVLVGDRYYIKATATLVDIEDGSSVSNTAFAREEESKKGMDGSQITGTASSYARKYCLNGLFAIDDTKDADTNEYQGQQAKPSGVSKQDIANLEELAKAKGVELTKALAYFKVATAGELTPDQYNKIYQQLKAK